MLLLRGSGDATVQAPFDRQPDGTGRTSCAWQTRRCAFGRSGRTCQAVMRGRGCPPGRGRAGFATPRDRTRLGRTTDGIPDPAAREARPRFRYSGRRMRFHGRRPPRAACGSGPPVGMPAPAVGRGLRRQCGAPKKFPAIAGFSGRAGIIARHPAFPDGETRRLRNRRTGTAVERTMREASASESPRWPRCLDGGPSAAPGAS